MYILTILFAIAKAIILVNGYNPHISETTELDSFQIFDKINLNEINYRVAFVIEDYDTYTTKNDAKYIKYIATIWTGKDGIES